MLPCLGLSLSMLFGACATTSPVGAIRCPAPNTAEIDDYALIVEADPDRPAVRWVARVISYCWPDEADEVRRADAR
ncbi:MAG: hypothetical protein NXI30_04575 [bacterium]|nr:hypothetical protein [bacterium]